MPVIQIEPLDTLFFRDGKPFNMGDEAWAEGMFPPNPSVIWGALFSALYGDEIRESLGDKEKKLEVENIEIDKIYLHTYNKGQHYFWRPFPFDYSYWIDDRKELQFIDIAKDTNFVPIKDNQEYLFCNLDKALKAPDSLFINENTLKSNYLSGRYNIEGDSYRKKSEFIKSNPKIGIQRNNSTRSSEDAHLFRIDMIEINKDYNFDFIISFNHKSNKAKENDSVNFMKFGGENKLSYIQVLDEKSIIFKEINRLQKEPINIQDEIANHEIFKLYFSTPLLLEGNNLEHYFSYENKVKFKAIITGKPVNIGGFNVKLGKPKPMIKAYPAGTVIYLKKEKGFSIGNYKIFLDKQLKNILTNRIDISQMTTAGYNSYEFGLYKRSK